LLAHFGLSWLNLLGVASTSLALSPGDALATALTIFASIIIGDFGTGVFHWAVDNYGNISTPVFGSVCAAFQGHHVTPWTITFRPFANNVYKICYASIPLLLSLLLLRPPPLTTLFFTLFINWWVLSQEFHKYAHMKSPPALISTLQDWNIILSRREHGLHHSQPFEAHYCILNGYCNAWLDKTEFFRTLERLVFRLTGKNYVLWGGGKYHNLGVLGLTAGGPHPGLVPLLPTALRNVFCPGTLISYIALNYV